MNYTNPPSQGVGAMLGSIDKYAGAEQAVQARRLDITIRQNLDEQIKQAEARVAELKETRERMEKSGILDTRIDDIQRALRW